MSVARPKRIANQPVGNSFWVLAVAVGVITGGLDWLIQQNVAFCLLAGLIGFVGVPALAVCIWLSITLLFVLPHEFGHWVFGRLNGFQLYAVRVYPFDVSFVPNRHVSVRWDKRLMGAVSMFGPDSKNEPGKWAWMLLGGPFGSALAGVCGLAVSRWVNDPELSQLIRSMAYLSLAAAIGNLIPAQMQGGIHSDGLQLLRLRRAPEAYASECALAQLKLLQSFRVPRSSWPEGLEEQASSNLDSYELKSTALQLRIVSQLGHWGAEEIAFEVDAGLREVESWPQEALANVVAYKIMAVLTFATNAMLRSASRHILPAPENMPRHLLASREIALAAVEVLEGDFDAAKARLIATEAKPAQDWKLSVSEGVPENLEAVRGWLKLFEGERSAIYRISCLWSNAVRPREWDRELIDEMAAYPLEPSQWGFSAGARLVYWLDVGEETQLNALIEEIENYGALGELGVRSRSRLWEELTVYYALQKNDPHKAAELFSRTEPDSASTCRSLKAANAVVLALSGDTAGSLAKLDEIEARIQSLPAWFPRHVEEAEKLARIRAFAEGLGSRVS